MDLLKGRRLLAPTMIWALAVSIGPALARAESVAQEEPLRVLAYPVVLNDEQQILTAVMVNGYHEKRIWVSKRLSFQPVDVRPEERDVWVEIRPKDKGALGRPAPDLSFLCSNHTPPYSKENFVEIGGGVGLTKLLPIECYGRLVKGARYEMVVHWKTTVPFDIRGPEKLFVKEVVSEPFTYTYLDLFEKKRSASAKLIQAGLSLSEVRMFLKKLVRQSEKRDWAAVCTMTTKPFQTRGVGAADDRSINTDEECERLMPYVVFGPHPDTGPEQLFYDKSADLLSKVYVRRQGDFAFGRFVFAEVCPSGNDACRNKEPKITWVGTRGFDDKPVTHPSTPSK